MVGTRSKNSDINTEESSSHSNLTLSEEKKEVIKSSVIKSIMAVINFLDVSVILHSDRIIETDIYYKDIYIIKTYIITPMITSLTTAHTQITLKIMYRTI